MGSGSDQYWKNKKKDQQVIEKLRKSGSICFDCAKDLGAKSNGSDNTCWQGTCDMCGEHKSCIAVTDWIWPKEYKIGYIWD